MKLTLCSACLLCTHDKLQNDFHLWSCFPVFASSNYQTIPVLFRTSELSVSSLQYGSDDCRVLVYCFDRRYSMRRAMVDSPHQCQSASPRANVLTFTVVGQWYLTRLHLLVIQLLQMRRSIKSFPNLRIPNCFVTHWHPSLQYILKMMKLTRIQSRTNHYWLWNGRFLLAIFTRKLLR